MLDAARYGWAYVRHNGVRATLRGIARRYVYRSLHYIVLCSRTIDEHAADRVGDVVFRLATPADAEPLRRFDRCRRALRQPVLAPQREWRFIACDGDRIVATRRYTDALPRHALIARVVQLGEGQLWADDLFCLPQYRNRGIARRLGLFAQRVLAAEGFGEFLGSIRATNAASLRMTLHDSAFVCEAWYVRCLFYERLRISRDLPRHLREVGGPGPSGA